MAANGESLDTETLLVMLESSLGGLELDHSELLEALLEADGDVEVASRRLRGEGGSRSTTTHNQLQPVKPQSAPKKRKYVDLESWLKPSSEEGRKRRVAYAETDSGVNMASTATKPPSMTKSSVPTSPAKPTVNLMEILKQAPTSTSIPVPRLAPMTLGTPELIAKHTPTTIHTSVLPPDLACRLYYRLLDDAEASWTRNKWYIAERLVESPHLTSFYLRDRNGGEWDEAARYWYNGKETMTPKEFPSEMEEACQYIEKIVNDQMMQRPRFSMEWGGETGWRANVAAANRYKGTKEGVGFHSDQMTYLGPCPTIASLSLGVTRIFRLRETLSKEEKEVRSAQTFNIPLPHNSLVIMHPPCQEYFKHSIPIIPGIGIDVFRPPFPKGEGIPIVAHTERINVTFRFYRPDFSPMTTPRCKCGIPTVLRANQRGRSSRIRSFEDSAESAGKTLESGMRYFWMCYSGAQNEGKGCGYLKILDMKEEGRGPLMNTRE